MPPPGEPRWFEIVERAEVPVDGLVLGYAAMLPFPAVVLAVWFGDTEAAAVGLAVLKIWGGAVLVFLAGVRRGLSFRTPGGPRAAQIAMAGWLFVAGLAAIVLPILPSLVLLVLGYASLLVLDPRAARRGEAPLYFARLRPWQMAIPLASLGLVAAGLR